MWFYSHLYLIYVQVVHLVLHYGAQVSRVTFEFIWQACSFLIGCLPVLGRYRWCSWVLVSGTGIKYPTRQIPVGQHLHRYPTRRVPDGQYQTLGLSSRQYPGHIYIFQVLPYFGQVRVSGGIAKTRAGFIGWVCIFLNHGIDFYFLIEFNFNFNFSKALFHMVASCTLFSIYNFIWFHHSHENLGNFLICLYTIKSCILENWGSQNVEWDLRKPKWNTWKRRL